MSHRGTEPVPSDEEATDALVDADVALRPGTARAALQHRDFRTVWLGAIAWGIGSWIRNVYLGVFAYQLTKSATFTGVVYFAQLGPSLVLPPLGGVLADTLDRRKLLLWTQTQQLVFALALAGFAAGSNPSKVGLVAAALMIGAGQALNGPAYSSLLPELVPRRDLAGAVSLQSTQMNGARVIGPAIGGVLYPVIGPAWLFAATALAHVVAMTSVWRIRVPRKADTDRDRNGWRRFVSGFAIARHDPLVRRVLVTMTLFSFFSLTFIGLLPVLAEENLGMDPDSGAYGLLYAAFGIGATAGAVSIGTVFADRSKPWIVQRALGAFAVILAVFALERMSLVSYPTIFVLGFVYFAAVTSMSTVLQQHLEDHVRGRVMALWIMSFGGTVPLGTFALSPVADATSVTVVALIGAVVAAVLAWYSDLRAVGAPA